MPRLFNLPLGKSSFESIRENADLYVGRRIYIIEFKCNQRPDAALAQIHDKGYARAYQGLSKKIILLGINFDTEKRNVCEWRVVEAIPS
jgi:hypothetical protein